MTYLLDTCILSKLRKLPKQNDPALVKWIDKQSESQFFLSVLTIAEIEQGIQKLKDEKQQRVFENWLRGELIPRFSQKILDINLKVATKWGELSGLSMRLGSPLPVIDGLIAATAIVNDLIVVTENIKDFSRIQECKIFSPWE